MPAVIHPTAPDLCSFEGVRWSFLASLMTGASLERPVTSAWVCAMVRALGSAFRELPVCHQRSLTFYSA